MEYISIKNCECNLKYTCLFHRPDYNYSLEDILKIENITKEKYLEILKLKSNNYLVNKW